MSFKCPGFLSARYWQFRQRRRNVRGWEELPDAVEVNDSDTKPAKSIAIVGNAGYVTDLAMGHKIDSCDLVLRMNNCRVDGFEEAVGKKTDIYMSNFFHDIDYDNPVIQTARLHVASRPNVFRKQAQIKQRFGEQIARGMEFGNIDSVYAPELSVFTQWCEQLGQEPTTGLMAILLALDTLTSIDRVYVTGFSFFEGKSHYFSDANVQPFHNITDERILVCDRLRKEMMTRRVDCDPILTQNLGLENNGLRIAI